MGEMTPDIVSECLAGNKTLDITVGWEYTHVTYSRMNGTSDVTTDDVIARNITTPHSGHDVNSDEENEHRCRLRVTPAEELAILHVKFVEQTCTKENKVVLRGKTLNIKSN